MCKRILVVFCMVCALAIVSVPAMAVDADSVLGIWQVESQTDDATQVTIYKCGEKYCGKISWLKDPETLDTKNPDESKRSQKLLGMDFISNFVFKKDEWSGGKIYDARSGKTYDCKMWYKDATQDVLNVKGYILFIGKTSVFYRMK